MAKKKASKKKAASKKTSKKSPKAKAKKPAAKKKPKMIVLQHLRLRRTGREMRHYRAFRGFVEVPEDRTRDLRLFKRLGYVEANPKDLAAARAEANDRAKFLFEQKKVSSLAEAKRVAFNRSNPGHVMTERDRIANQARVASEKFNTELRRLTNTLQKAKVKAAEFRKRTGRSQIPDKDAKAIGRAEGAIAKLRAQSNPELRGRKATAKEENRREKEQGIVDAVRSEEAKKAEKDGKAKKKELDAKAKKEAVDRAKTTKNRETAQKLDIKEGPQARGRQETADLEQRREAEEAEAEKERKRKADETAKAKKAAEGKATKDK